MKQVKPLIIDTFTAGLVPNLLSSPGLGKSALAAQIAEQFNLKLIDIRLSYYDPADLNGFPKVLERTLEQAKAGRPEKAGYMPMDTFPIEGDPLPVKTWKTVKAGDGVETKVPDEYYKGWLIILDEFNSAPLAVQAASYKLVLDKVVGQYPLHKAVAMMTAGNRSSDRAIVNRVSTAMQSRLVSFDIMVDVPAWMEWANKIGNIDFRVKSFIEFKPDMLHRFKPDHDELTFACPRTWEFVSKLIRPFKEIKYDKVALLNGAVGESAALEFYAFSELYAGIPTIKEIIDDPEGCRLGAEKGVHYALSGLVGQYMEPSNAAPLTKFMRRMDIDFQVVTFTAAIARDREIARDPQIKKWIADNAQELL
jgi:hypothetical protein